MNKDKFYKTDKPENDPFIKDMIGGKFVRLLPDTNSRTIGEWMHKVNYPCHRCYHRDGTYHFVGANESNCGCRDVDILSIAERDGVLDCLKKKNRIYFHLDGKNWEAKPINDQIKRCDSSDT